MDIKINSFFAWYNFLYLFYVAICHCSNATPILPKCLITEGLYLIETYAMLLRTMTVLCINSCNITMTIPFNRNIKIFGTQSSDFE